MNPHLWIVNQYALPKGEAGITRHGDLASELVNLGYDVTIFASSFDYLTRERDRLDHRSSRLTNHDGVKFVWLKTPPYMGNDGTRVKNMVTFFGAVMRVASFGKYGKPDVILGSSPHLLSGLAGLLLGMRYRVPFFARTSRRLARRPGGDGCTPPRRAHPSDPGPAGQPPVPAGGCDRHRPPEIA